MEFNIDDDQGWIRVSAFGRDPLSDADLVLLTVSFDIAEEAAGTTVIDLDELTTAVNEGQIPLVIIDGTLSVVPYPQSWHNERNQLDVNEDGFVSPVDVLIVINRLNADPTTLLPPTTATNHSPPFFDVNDDGFVSPVDVLLVINYLNR